ncbi:thioredoxin-like domain-containing protein [Kineosporia sp. NBRC 101677]|uniref:thioredoxin-like domain-containing protein n=1 Tax=Kineosporia sp. NBRC 101677 TaxID=3032197 RepID=UPI0025550210|nr:thioredoxin-like domain-containing protein [Kineosporia sp. NBRC 101677]
MRIRAPRLRGRGWLNSPGLDLQQLRGRWVMLDFWTGACVNCVHVLDELRPLERQFADVLTVIGVHSPKFPYEATASAVANAVERYRVEHPVLDDADLLTWDAYAVNAWPTLVLIDPDGYVVAQVSGEGHVPELAGLISEKLEDGVPASVPPAPVRVESPQGLRFPGGLVALSDGEVLTSDTGNQRLLLGQKHIGSGIRGFVDGPAGTAQFADPLGAAVLPPDVAAKAGYDVVIADSGNDALRGLRLDDLSVSTVATGISTPGDVAWFDSRIVVAGIGRHQLWSVDPACGEVQVYAGTGKEGLVDGPAEKAWFAQPSGLSVDFRGLWIVDAESSALRLLYRADDGSLQVRTAIGQGLFEFGQDDGPAWDARLQHPLGVQALPDGKIAVADTFNGSVRAYDPITDQVTTLLTGLGEPSALTIVLNQLWVADAGQHQVHRLEGGWDEPAGPAPVQQSVADLDPEGAQVTVRFTPPPGEETDTRDGDPTWLEITAQPASLLEQGAGGERGLNRRIAFAGELSGGRVNGRLLVEARAASCDISQEAGAVCHLHRRRWEIPVRLIPGSTTELDLKL